MKRSFLSRLQSNGRLFVGSALILLLIIPLYQLLLLGPQGYSDALLGVHQAQRNPFLLWVTQHVGLFLGYRLLLALAFALLINLPFTLFRVIVAQELIEGQADEEDEDEEGEDEANGDDEKLPVAASETEAEDDLPPYSWRGKGFAVLAAWAGLSGVSIFVLGTLASTAYIALSSMGITTSSPTPSNFEGIVSSLTLLSNTIGGGFLAIGTLLFGAAIARRGLRLWPGIWVAFGYGALTCAALWSGSAVAVASAPENGQGVLTTPAILLFALWTLWLGIMLIRLKPES